MENSIFNEIARTVSNNTSSAIEGANYASGFSLGTITPSGLNVDSVKSEYSREDYYILDNLNIPENIRTESENEHSHEIKVPDNLKPLQIGDRVLVAVMGANAVILGRVKNA